MRNGLNSLYAKQLRIAKMFPRSLDDPPSLSHGSSKRRTIRQSNARTEHGKESAGPIEQEQLKPGLSNFVDQQDAQRFGGADQNAESNSFVSKDELTMRHN